MYDNIYINNYNEVKSYAGDIGVPELVPAEYGGTAA